ncbi:MAG: WG repeat-containing protein [Solobacterium sp.]|nr:WG repeat-containing protein [Solobacterium sp.]
MKKQYRKALNCLLPLILMGGCTQEKEPEPTPEPSAEPEVFSVWDIEPSLTYTSVKIPEPYFQTEVRVDTASHGKIPVIADVDRKGYAQIWNGAGYTPDSVIISNGTSQGIADYTGTEIYPLSVNVHSTPFAAGISAGRVESNGNVRHVFGSVNTTKGTASVFANDFKTTEQFPLSEYTYDPYKNNTYAYFAVKDKVFGIVIPLKDSEGDLTYEYDFEKYTGPAMSGRMIVPVVDPMFYTEKYVLCEADGKIIGNLAGGRGTYRKNSFINGFYVIAQANEATFIKVGAGQVGLTYNDAKYFEDGLAPVARYGKWGFINEKGEEVSDFLFDDALPVYDGKTWVKYNNKWGILNLRRALDTDQFLTVSTCFADEGEPIGTLTVSASSLTIRSSASTSASKAGMCRKGAVYQVYETKEGQGYTWYRVSKEHWVPNNGKWAVYQEGNNETGQ